MPKRVILLSSISVLLAVALVGAFYGMGGFGAPPIGREPGQSSLGDDSGAQGTPEVHEINKFEDEPDTIKCLARVRRNISFCDVEIESNLSVYMDVDSCRQDYYFFVGVIDADAGLCQSLSDERSRTICNAIVLKQEDAFTEERCSSEQAVCDYIIGNDFVIGEGFCDVFFDSELGARRCKAIFTRDEASCYEQAP
jgi:hypothetical protein